MSAVLRLVAVVAVLALTACGGTPSQGESSAAAVEEAFADEGFVLVDSGLFDAADEVMTAFFSAEDPRDDESVEPVLYVGVFAAASDAQTYAIPAASPFDPPGPIETSGGVVLYLAPHAPPSVSAAARRAMAKLR